jgi:hypothetical protein
MRWLACLVVLAVVVTAHASHVSAHPVRRPFDGDDVFGPRFRPPPPCPRTSRWEKFVACEYKKTKVSVLHDQPTAKLIASVPAGYQAGYRRIELVFLTGGAWVKSGFYTETNPTSELLGYQQLAKDTYRIDVGYAAPTWVTTDDITTRPALVRHAYTYVCAPALGCRSVMTACDVLVHGKTISTFHGTPKWDGKQLQIQGDVRNTNRYCAAPPNVLDPVEDSE